MKMGVFFFFLPYAALKVVDYSPFTGLVDQCCKANPQPTVYNTGP